MPRYRITNRVTRESAEIEAPYAQDACALLGWLIGDCYVQLLREGPYSRLDVGRELVQLWARGRLQQPQPPADDDEVPF